MKPRPSHRASLGLVALLLVTLPTCGGEKGFCGFPEMPPEGHYRVANPEDLPIEVTSVVVEGDQMTIDYLDESGVAQQVVYQIREGE